MIQVEAPLSVSSALQRIGRAGHQVGQSSSGRLLPKFGGRPLRGQMHMPAQGDIVFCQARF